MSGGKIPEVKGNNKSNSVRYYLHRVFCDIVVDTNR